MTELTDFQQKTKEIYPEISLRFWEPLEKHTSFRIGGPAEVMAFPKNREQLGQLFHKSVLLDCKPVILGAGTNVLAPDEGVRGLVICLKDCLDGMELLGDHCLQVYAGVTMARAAVFAAKNGLSGLEFAHGIPGTVGGGVYMNAGAYGSDISRVCVSAEVMDRDGNIRTVCAQELDFSYRHSALEDTGETVVSATFRLTPEDPERIRDRMKQLQAKRLASQPLNLPSAGSAFKRPAQGYAAALIDEAGLKGYRVGDAAISEKHAGFAVNLGNATAAQVRQLLQEVAQNVKTISGIALEPEIRIWK